MLKLVPAVAALMLIALGTAATSAAPSGTAVGVDPAAEARGEETRTLVVGADIFIGDRVVTGARGQVQILFSDQTKLVVGPRSALLIEDYLLRNNGSAGKFAINALSGTFRFVTGGAPKDRYAITTPTGTIGVRGTAFELFVAQAASYVMMQHGATVLRPNNGDSVTLDSVCEVGVMTADGADVIGQSTSINTADRQQLRDYFIYAVNQRPLMRPFRLNGAEGCLNRPVVQQVAPSLSDPGSGGEGNSTTQTQQSPADGGDNGNQGN